MKALTPAALRKELHRVGNLEIDEWKGPMKAAARAIIVCFTHRVMTGERIEESFPSRNRKPENDYQI